MTDRKKGRNPVHYGVCETCGHLMLPVLDMSPCGHTGPVDRRPLDDIGTVYSWTRVHLGEDRLLVMADFFDGKLRVTAPLLDADSAAIGDQVVLVVGKDTPYAYMLA